MRVSFIISYVLGESLGDEGTERGEVTQDGIGDRPG